MLNKENLLILAPLSEITTLSFRIMARQFGADLTLVPLVSSYAIVNKNQKTLDMLIEGKKESKPRAVQIFGNDKEVIKRAVRIIDELSIYDIIDLNAGCPSSKIVNSGSGGALLKDLPKLREILRAIRENTKSKVSVKIRLGFSKNDLTNIIKAVDDFVDMITIHGRTIKQSFSGNNDWQSIFQAKALTDKIIIGSGDIRTKEDYLKVKDKVNGVMIGRAALSNPGIFSEIKFNKPISKSRALLRLTELEKDFLNLKKLSLFMVAGMNNSKRIKREITKIKDYDTLVNYLTFLAKEMNPE